MFFLKIFHVAGIKSIVEQNGVWLDMAEFNCHDVGWSKGWGRDLLVAPGL
jgi:hypothetical protein